MNVTRGPWWRAREGARTVTIGLVVGATLLWGASSVTSQSARASEPERPADVRERATARDRLPVVDLRVRGKVPDEDKKTGRIEVRSKGRTVLRGRIGIETRGQSSLDFPKQPYGFEVRDRLGGNRNVPMLGMPADDDWILYAPYSDKTLMRNVLAYQTARWIGGYASRTRFVELRLNGRYRGVYVLMEQLKLLDDRIDRPEPAQLLEWVHPSQVDTKGSDFLLPNAAVPIVFDDPKREDLDQRRRQGVRRSLVAADAALYSPGFADPRTGWRRHLDEASAVDFFVLSELFMNMETFVTSTYLTRGKGERWSLGPIWDADVSMGNFSYPSANLGTGSLLTGRPWAARFYADPAFVAAVADRWRALRADGIRERLLAEVSRNVAELVSTRATVRNFRRWPVLGEIVWPNPPEAATRTTYDGEVQALTAWLDARIAWLDANVHTLAPAP